MEKKLPRLTRSEFEIMSIVWENEKATVGAIAKAVNSQRADKLRQATIRVQVIRLEEKGWLVCRKEKSHLYYAASVPRGETTSNIVKDVRARAFNGSYLEMVKALFSEPDISSQEIQEVRNFIDQRQKGKE